MGSKTKKCYKVVKNLGNGKLVSVMLPEWHPLRKVYRTASGNMMRIPQCMVFETLSQAQTFASEQAAATPRVSCELAPGQTLEVWEAEAVIINPTYTMISLEYMLRKDYWNKKGERLSAIMASLRDLEICDLFNYFSKENDKNAGSSGMLSGALEAKKLILTKYVESHSRR